MFFSFSRQIIVILLCLIVNCVGQCFYRLIHSNGSLSRCQSDRCDQYLDFVQLEEEDEQCRTTFVVFAFSTWKNYRKFLDGFHQGLSNLFIGKSLIIKRNVQRHLRIFFNEIDDEDQPFDYEEIRRLGKQIDLYEIFIKNLSETHQLRSFVSIHRHYSQWFFIQLKISCRLFNGFDRYPCSTEFLFPMKTFLSPQIFSNEISSNQSSKSNETIEQQSFFPFSSSYSFESMKIFFFLLFLFLLFIFLLFVFLFWKYFSTRKSIEQSEQIDKQSISSSNDQSQRNSSSSLKMSSNRVTNEIYERLPLETISSRKEFQFVPIRRKNYF